MLLFLAAAAYLSLCSCQLTQIMPSHSVEQLEQYLTLLAFTIRSTPSTPHTHSHTHTHTLARARAHTQCTTLDHFERPGQELYIKFVHMMILFRGGCGPLLQWCVCVCVHCCCCCDDAQSP